MTFRQFQKASFAKSVFLDTLTRVRDSQPRKASLPIDVTEGGRLIWVREVQPEKAQPPIDVTEGGIIVFEHPLIKVLLSV